MDFILYSCARAEEVAHGVNNYWQNPHNIYLMIAHKSDCNTAFSFWLGAEADSEA